MLRRRAAWRRYNMRTDRPEVGRLQISAAEFARRIDHVLRVDTAFFHHFCTGCA
jgi:hypothetical protein